MEIVYFIIAAIVLYVFSSWLLNRVEVSRGERFENRQVIFLAILMVLAIGSFALIQYFAGG
jgi:hypothetical protein